VREAVVRLTWRPFALTTLIVAAYLTWLGYQVLSVS
jgi:hypothetical protein